jgi:hypothetical protein
VDGALQALPPRKPEAKAKFVEIVNSKKNDDVLRLEALRGLARGNATDALDAALTIVRDPGNGGTKLQLAAVQMLGELCLLHRLTADRHHEAETALADVVKSGTVPLRHAAIESLAVLQAAEAPALLRAQLESKTPWLSPREAISLLKTASPQSAETYAALKRYLDSPDPTTQALAIQGLTGDADTRQRRMDILLDVDAPEAVRRAALQSMMHNDPGFPEAALRIALDSASDLELRREAVAGVALYARNNRVGKDRLNDWIARLRPLESAPRKNLRATATLIIQSLEKLAKSR